MNQSLLQRFIDAQIETYEQALAEIKAGRKVTHWMWFIFPQLNGLGQSEMTKFYAIKNHAQASGYLHHPLLGPRLVEISKATLIHSGLSARDIFGKPDDKKLQSCMTLFSLVHEADPVFRAVLDKYFDGERDDKTIKILIDQY